MSHRIRRYFFVLCAAAALGVPWSASATILKTQDLRSVFIRGDVGYPLLDEASYEEQEQPPSNPVNPDALFDEALSFSLTNHVDLPLFGVNGSGSVSAAANQTSSGSSSSFVGEGSVQLTVEKDQAVSAGGRALSDYFVRFTLYSPYYFVFSGALAAQSYDIVGSASLVGASSVASLTQTRGGSGKWEAAWFDDDFWFDGVLSPGDYFLRLTATASSDGGFGADYGDVAGYGSAGYRFLLDLRPVPEPGSLALLGLGLAGLGLSRRRKAN